MALAYAVPGDVAAVPLHDADAATFGWNPTPSSGRIRTAQLPGTVVYRIECYRR